MQKGALVSITVFCKTIKENSGAGLLDYETGIVLTIASLIQSLFQFLMLPKIINKLGAYKTIILLGLISPLGFLMVRFVG